MGAGWGWGWTGFSVAVYLAGLAALVLYVGLYVVPCKRDGRAWSVEDKARLRVERAKAKDKGEIVEVTMNVK